MTVSVVDAGCTLVATVLLGCLDEACALQQTKATTQMMMGRTESTIPATVPPTIPPTLPIQRDMIITQVKSHYLPKWISLASFPGSSLMSTRCHERDFSPRPSPLRFCILQVSKLEVGTAWELGYIASFILKTSYTYWYCQEYYYIQSHHFHQCSLERHHSDQRI